MVPTLSTRLLRTLAAFATCLTLALLITTLSIPPPPVHAADICWLTHAPIAGPAPAAAEEPSGTEVWFSPGDRIRDRLIAAINHTRKTLDAALYEFSSPEIAYAIVAAYERGVALYRVRAGACGVNLLE
jgi:hypothetical protein